MQLDSSVIVITLIAFQIIFNQLFRSYSHRSTYLNEKAS